ncbi:hypothetical protein AUF78_07635 [archaeon 13_1_20CM_2_51_12]|nr:MAG: hypothetical protein AUF78_07635 [archaeon 13_1_20CM_2_51_12]
MFPNKAKMVRSANSLWLILAVAPALYLVIAALVTLGKPGFARDQTLVLWVFFLLVIVSVAQLGLTVFFQTRKTLMQTTAVYGPVGRTYLTMATGSILSEAHAIYGLVLTLLSGSIFYGVGFSLVAWASLFWVRGRFKQNLGKLPDNKPNSTS